MDFQVLKDSVYSSPAFVLDETEVIKALETLAGLKTQCGCKVLYSIKSLPCSAVMDMAKSFVDGFSVSSLFEARLADEVLAGQGSIHLTTPGIRHDELDQLSALCSHISFNSLTQYQRYAEAAQEQALIGLRVNPKLSFLHDERFDPCRQHSKLGVAIDELSRSICLDQLQGLHVHNIFSATDFRPLIKTIDKLRQHLGAGLAQLEWLNIGGGYLFGQIEDHRPFVELVNKLIHDFSVEVYIEPGKAVVGRAGYLVATVLDSFVSPVGRNKSVRAIARTGVSGKHLIGQRNRTVIEGFRGDVQVAGPAHGIQCNKGLFKQRYVLQARKYTAIQVGAGIEQAMIAGIKPELQGIILTGDYADDCFHDNA